MPFIPHTPDEVQEMLSVVGVRNLDDLFADIPPEMRPKHFDLPKGQSEFAVCRYFEDLAAGAGFYAHYVPRAVDALSGRSEFYTSYTPYQAECSQGTLQAIFEYQTAVSRLLDMDCANASVYDGGTALFEACMMAVRATRRKKLVVDQCINPVWRAMLETYSSSLDITLVTVPHKDGLSDMEGLKAAVDATCAAVLVQNPNFFGAVADFSELFAHARACKALGVISVYPVMQSVLKTPGEMGADIAVAEGQSLGQPLSFGGPYLGIMTCHRLCAHPAGPRAAHPPRQGHVQHLLQPVPVRPARAHVPFAGGSGRSGPRGRTRHGPGPLRGGKTHGPARCLPAQ